MSTPPAKRPSASSTTSASEPFTSRLFLRIYAAFIAAVLVFAVLVGLLVWAAASSWDEERIAAVIDQAASAGEPLARALLAQDHDAIASLVATLEAKLDAEVSVLPRQRGRRLGPAIGGSDNGSGRGSGQERHRPPSSEHPITRAEIQRIRQGQPLVHRRGLGPPTIGLGLFESGFANVAVDDEGHDDDLLESEHIYAGNGIRERGRFIAVVTIDPNRSALGGLIGVGVLLLLALAGGAWPLARSLTSRLAKLERSTRALARGELSHRAELSHPQPRDEVDQLAVAFNLMAERLETLMTGQRSLLANVSHELRTPIARAKVLLEILVERVELVRAAEQRGEPVDPAHLARLERGFDEMQEDFGEVEALIQDLLTSGRLELGRDSALALEPLDLATLCTAAASRFDAIIECAPGLSFEGDRMLLERLLKNLLANARRACPDGAIVIRGARVANEIVIEIEDEGPGIPSTKRSFIFEPFARLDAARARDEGGVGLGLYLCRQIVSAHRGTIRAEDRLDGHPGARFVIRLGT